MFTTIIVNNLDRLKLKGNKVDAQQLHDHIIKPTLEYMGGNYDSKNARMMLLATAAIESKCGYYIKQVGGPALGIWQMEPATHDDIWSECDKLKGNNGFVWAVEDLGATLSDGSRVFSMITYPMYACAMARLKYSMDIEQLPDYDDINAIYRYYKRIYNTEAGASTMKKFVDAWNYCGLDKVKL